MVLARGLRARPEDRHPDMGALLRALEADPRRARLRALVAVVPIAAVAGAVVLARASTTPAVT